jgi:acyl carrier protein
VELGEIESVLREQPGVVEAAVVALGEGSEDRRLVGCVVLSVPGSLDVEGLSSGLSARLPGWMVPREWLELARLPLSSNGKLDRTKLLELSAGRVGGAKATYVGPRTSVEAVLCGIWSELLGVSAVGVEDNFFVLGGHSLLATQVVSRIRNELQVELPLGLLFSAPTIEGLAEALLQGEDRDAVETTARISLELAQMSDEEVEALLAARSVDPDDPGGVTPGTTEAGPHPYLGSDEVKPVAAPENHQAGQEGLER